MKYSPKIYARAFAAAAADKSRSEELLVKNLIAAVRKNGDMRQMGKIVYLVEKILLKKSGRDKWLAETARPVKNLRAAFKNLIKAEDFLEEKIDPGVIAGIRITMNDERQFDGTLNKKINKLFS